MKITKEKKLKILNLISDNLSYFENNLKGYFVCPVCLDNINLDSIDKITMAHIIPEAAGGKLITWLCGKCNSGFGEKQDKWFGEYLNLLKDKSIFPSDLKKAKLIIDDLPVNGAIRKTENGIDFFVYKNRNSPKANEVFSQEMGKQKASPYIPGLVPSEFE